MLKSRAPHGTEMIQSKKYMKGLIPSKLVITKNVIIGCYEHLHFILLRMYIIPSSVQEFQELRSP
jgi:hypothetical protein